MNIKEKITEWQETAKHQLCCTRAEEAELDNELELVLFAIDELTNAALKEQSK